MVGASPPFVILTGLERSNDKTDSSVVSCIQGIDNYVWFNAT